MLSIKTPTIIVAGVAAVVALAVPGAASAARVAGSTETIAQTRVVAPTTSTAMTDAGSAGIEGYTDAKCRSLLGDWVTATNFSNDSYSAGDTAASDKYREQSKKIEEQLSDNCMVVD